MTGSTVLVVRVPRPIEDADACIEHIKRGLRDGILVLGADVKYSVETFPPLGAVEVVSGNAVPVVIGGSRPTPAGGGGGLVVGGRVVRSVPDSGTEKEPPKKELPDIPAAEGVSCPEPKPPAPPPKPEAAPKTGHSNRTVFRASHNAQQPKAPAKRTLPMSAGEIVSSYKQAAKPEEQIRILAELNDCTTDEIREILVQLGVELPKAKKRQPGRPRKGSV